MRSWQPLEEVVAAPRHGVTLGPGERAGLAALTRTAKAPGKVFRNARALPLCDKGLEGPAWTVRLLAAKAVELRLAQRVSPMAVQRIPGKANCVLA